MFSGVLACPLMQNGWARLLADSRSTAALGTWCVQRPFAMQSRTLSVCVPRKRWSGFTQAGLSHLWQTNIPSGIGLHQDSQAYR